MYTNKIKSIIYKFLKQSEKYTKTDMIYLAKGSFWLSLLNVVLIVKLFLITLAFANLLPQEVYGEYKYILSIFAILCISSLPGMGTAVKRAVAMGFEGTTIKGYKTKIYWGIIGSLISIVLALYYFIQDNEIMGMSLLLLALCIPLFDSSGIYNSYLQGKKFFKQSAKYIIAIEIFAGAFLIATLFITDKLFYILLAYILPYIILRSLFLIYVTKKYYFNQKIENESISYGKHLTILSILARIAAQLDKVILWHFLGAIPLAIYSFAIALPDQMKLGINEIRTLSFPKLSTQDNDIIKKTLPKKIFIAMLLLIPIIILYILAAPIIFKIFFPQYIDSIFYSQIYALSIFLVPQSVFLTYLESKAKKKQLYILNFLVPTAKIALLLILIPIYGIIGAILSIVITRTISLASLYYLFKTS